MKESTKPSGNLFVLFTLLSIPAFLTLKNFLFDRLPVEYWGKPTTAITYYPMNTIAWLLFIAACWAIGKVWAKQGMFLKVSLGLAMLGAFVFFGFAAGLARTSPITPKNCYAEYLMRVDGCTSESPPVGFVDTPYRQISYGLPNAKLCEEAFLNPKNSCPSFLDPTRYACIHFKDEDIFKEKTQIFASDCKKAAVFVSKSWEGDGFSHDLTRFQNEVLKYFKYGF